MDHNFYNNNDFEEFLRQKADQYKMYPSDRVWNNIYHSLHGRKRWLALGLTLVFITSSLFIGKQELRSHYKHMATQLNKGPETTASTRQPAAHGTRLYSAVPVQPIPTPATRAAITGTTPVAKRVVNHSTSTGGIATVSSDVSRVSVNDMEGQSMIIENDPLPALTGARENTNPNTKVASALPKELPGADKSIAPKTTALKEDKPKENDKLKAANAATPLPQQASAFAPIKPSRLFLQFYVSPMISYRRLSNQNQPDYNTPVSASYAGNINQYVHHEPAHGLEAGAKLLFKLSNSLSLYAGAQLNYSRYYIDAYKYRVEKASIALSSAQRPDTVSGYTTIRNFSGYQPEQLQNQYWQLSVPIGIEIKLLGDKKLQLNVAGGIQPTYVINSDSYLISSDYKNYIQSPDLARTFNVHTNFEAFFSYQAGGYKWQLGPQFRSQLLSSYSNQYRVREYLTEFGIKFGITKSFR